MALPKDYADQRCSLSRSLEVLGERWTLLVLRDAFYGVRRFSDFVEHLGIPRSVLASRLETLVGHQVLTKTSHHDGGHAEYELTDKGRELWPVIYGLIFWGDEHYAQSGPPRVFEHTEDGGRMLPDGLCSICGDHVPLSDIQATPGPGLVQPENEVDRVTQALSEPRPLLEPIRR
jgi:DNA-binding HxlR family transcriptional regulator